METPSQKEQTLSQLRDLLASGELTAAELGALTAQPVAVASPIPSSVTPAVVAEPEGRSKALGAALYVIGAVIVCSGIAALVGQSWSELDTFGRIIFTLGLGVLFLSIGAYLKLAKKSDDMLSETMLTIGSVALVIGSGVVAHELGFDLESSGVIAVISLVLVVTNILLYLLLKSPIIAFAALAVNVVFVLAFVNFLGGEDAPSSLAQYTLLFNGAWLIAAGLFMRSRAVLSAIAGSVQVFGAFFLLGMAFVLMVTARGFLAEETTSLWPVIYPGLLGIAIYASVVARSKGLLLSSSLFLTLYILYITLEYFSDTLGWPFSLMLSGVAIIAIAFGVRQLNHRFLNK